MSGTLKSVRHKSDFLGVIRKRLMIKAVSYRLFGSLATAFIVFAVTKNVSFGITIGIFDTLIKIILFYIHELFWEKAERVYDKYGNIK